MRKKKFALFICKGSTVLIVDDGSGYVLVVDTHFHPDLSSRTVFIYGIACAVASIICPGGITTKHVQWEHSLRCHSQL